MNRTVRLLRPGLLALALLGLAAAAPAQVTLFTDRAAFTGAATGLTTIDFNDQVTPPDTFVNYPGNIVTLSGVTFTPDQLLFAIAASSNYGLGDGTVLSWQRTDQLSPSVLTVALPAGVTAVGMDFGGFSSPGIPYTFALSTGDTFVLTGGQTPTATPTFAGFISTTPFTGFTISATEFGPQIDRFAFNPIAPQAGAVPEPGTLALLLVGAMTTGMGTVAHRRRA